MHCIWHGLTVDCNITNYTYFSQTDKMGSECVTNEMLQEAIAKEFNVPMDDVTVDSVDMKPGSNKGDGFACEIGAATVQTTIKGQGKKELDYICKFIPKNSGIAPMLRKVMLHED